MSDNDVPEPVELTELADHLLADLPHHPSGRTARTVLAGDALRAVVIALRDGVEMAEHDSPPGAALYCIRGHLTLRSTEREWVVHPGQLVPIPPRRHAVEAHADSAFLLTVALARPPA
ncbi:MAG: LuxR family transcriptional regulator [Nocardioidaceae bacterium]